MPNRSSLGQRILKAKTMVAKRKTLLTWLEDWRAEQDRVLDSLTVELKMGNTKTVDSAIRQIEAISGKRFPALKRVIEGIMLGEENKTN